MKKINLIIIIILHFHCINCNQRGVLPLLQIDFDKSMSHLKRYQLNYTQKDPTWIQTKKLYKKYIFNNFEYSNEPKIPKIIHQIWLGSKLPHKYKEYQESWVKKHPDWLYKLWTEKDIENLDLINLNLYKASKNYGEKSDIARYEILYQCGGLYVDTDFECLMPFDTLHHACDFYTGCVAAPHVVCFNGLIAAKPNHPILQRCINDLAENSKKHKKTLEKTGPGFFTRCVIKEFFNESVERCVLFPAPYFYPWPWYKRDHESCKKRYSFVRPESFAIHHWEVSWSKKKIN